MESQERKTMQQYIKLMEGEIRKALPSTITPERFIRITLSALSTNPKLGDCTPNSFLGAMMNAAQLGLEPNTPAQMSWLIPYYNRKKGVLECQFQIGYKGLIHLTKDSVIVDPPRVVYENDEFEYEYGLEPFLHHKPAMKDRGAPVAYYCVFHTRDGVGRAFEVWSYEDVLNHAKEKSPTFKNGPWQTDFDSMAKKTVLKSLLKYAPMTPETEQKISQDGTVKSTLSADMFDVPDETIYTEGEVVEESEEVQEA